MVSLKKAAVPLPRYKLWLSFCIKNVSLPFVVKNW